MTEISFSDEDIAAVAVGLETQADALDALAVETDAQIAAIQAGATSFQTTYKPRGVHKMKSDELCSFFTSQALAARSLATVLRGKAQNARTYAEQQGATQQESAANVDSISTEGVWT